MRSHSISHVLERIDIDDSVYGFPARIVNEADVFSLTIPVQDNACADLVQAVLALGPHIGLGCCRTKTEGSQAKQSFKTISH